MAKLSRGALAALATAGVAAVGVGAFVWTRRKRDDPAPEVPVEPNPAAQHHAREPAGGYESRWNTRRDAAITVCRHDPDVNTFAQAITCALNTAYPEAAPWTDPGVWSPWMHQAAQLVSAELVEAATGQTNPRGWELVVWLGGERALEGCRHPTVPIHVAARCAAQRLYPTVQWHGMTQPWQDDVLRALATMAVAP